MKHLTWVSSRLRFDLEFIFCKKSGKHIFFYQLIGGNTDKHSHNLILMKTQEPIISSLIIFWIVCSGHEHAKETNKNSLNETFSNPSQFGSNSILSLRDIIWLDRKGRGKIYKQSTKHIADILGFLKGRRGQGKRDFWIKLVIGLW